MRTAHMLTSLLTALVFTNFSSQALADSQPQATLTETTTFDPKQLARELKELRSSLSELKHSAKSLLGEYQRSDVRILEFGDFLNDYIDDKPPVPYQEQLYAYGAGNFGNTGTTNVPLPPRKQWVDQYRDNVGRLALLTKQELEDIVTKLPASFSTEVDQCRSLMDALSKTVAQIGQLNEKSDKKESQRLISELLDDISHIELSSKRLVRRHITPQTSTSP